ncbi:MAG: twin-arginine translocation signal domain-containing protein [Chloroflexota bacterium]
MMIVILSRRYTMQASRRTFLKQFGAGAAGGALLLQSLIHSGQVEASSPNTQHYSGTDLSGWAAVLGDAQWSANGQYWPDNNDINTNHLGGESELEANILNRGIMTHNITYDQWVDTAALDYIHVASYEFRIPEVPTPGGNPNFNAQTLEGGYFIWDGPNTRLDYGLAFQWMLNPWISDFGHIRIWTGPAGWFDIGYLQPDTNWHTIEFMYDHQNNATGMVIDGNVYASQASATPKDASWGSEMAVRFQAEIISLWPGEVTTAPHHHAYFRNWSTTWLPYSSIS